MAETRVRPNSSTLTPVDEVNGHYITAEKAAEMLEVAKPSFFSIAYEHATELGAVRIGGIILVDKRLAEAFRAKRNAEIHEREAKRKEREALAKVGQEKKALVNQLSNLSPEQIKSLLAQVQNGKEE